MLVAVTIVTGARGTQYVSVPASTFRSALAPDGKSAPAAIQAFRMRTLPVSNADYQVFVRKHTAWQRGRVPALFADAGYLRTWERDTTFGSGLRADQPVTHVSWFAADAYCRSEGARLPTWYEWELVSAADDHRKDAREDSAWRERLLTWYSRPSGGALPVVGQSRKNVYGVHDMHGLIWEWVDDFTSIMVSTDSREQGDPDLRKYCGAGAIEVGERENYALQMRLAMLSSLQAAYTTGNLGFRCVKPLQDER